MLLGAPKRGQAVPRNPFKQAGSFKAGIIQGPKRRLRKCPFAGSRLAMIGGARWKPSFTSPSNRSKVPQRNCHQYRAAHLVLGFARHQLVKRARGRFRQGTGALTRNRKLCGLDAADCDAVTLWISCVLVPGKIGRYPLAELSSSYALGAPESGRAAVHHL